MLVPLEISAAFDTVVHNILIQRQKYSGIKGKALSWFEMYLIDSGLFMHMRSLFLTERLGSEFHRLLC